MPRSQGVALSLFWRTFVLLAILLGSGIMAWVWTLRSLEFEPRAVAASQQIASLVNLARAALKNTDAINRVAMVKTLAGQEAIRIAPHEPSDKWEPFEEDRFTRVVAAELHNRLGPDTIVARIHAVLRRRPSLEAPGAPAKEAMTVTFGPFEFDLALRRLSKEGEQIALTTGEFSMLKALVRHPRQPLSRDKLAQLARGREFEPFDRSLDVQISRLRKMIESDPSQPRYIQTVWGVGYVFVPDGAN